MDKQAIDDIRLALNQNQPLGNSRFYAKIESMTGQRREALILPGAVALTLAAIASGL